MCRVDFLGMGLAGVKALDCEGEDLQCVFNTVDYIATLRQADDLATLPIGRRIVVIGGGTRRSTSRCRRSASAPI
jgi:dihydropyrimidine dehydrogenase (NAD+) subunit PreT